VRSRLLAGQRPQGWHTAQLVDRTTASTGLQLKVA
jgi:hypothetical protein